MYANQSMLKTAPRNRASNATSTLISIITIIINIGCIR